MDVAAEFQRTSRGGVEKRKKTGASCEAPVLAFGYRIY